MLPLFLLHFRGILFLKARFDDEERRFNEYVDRVIADTTKRLQRYEMILRGGAGVFAASEEVTRDEWQAYYKHQQVDTLYPGVQRIAFSRIITHRELAQHIEGVRAEGFPDYTVWPAEDREFYAPLIYLEPFDNNARSFLGFDLLTDPLRLPALEQARDNGKAALSGMIILVSETTRGRRPGFMMVVPVYENGLTPDTVEERRLAIKGYVIGSFIAPELMAGIFTDPVHKIDFLLYDGTEISPETLLYDSHVQPEEDSERHPLFTSTETIDLYGHQWTMAFESMPAFEAVADRNSHWPILGAGLLISILIFLYLNSLTTTGDRAHTLARKMTNELRESEEQLRAITDNVSDVVTVCNTEGIVTYMSPQSHKVLGYKPEELVGKTVFELVFLDDLPEVMQTYQDKLKAAVSGKAEYRAVAKDGSLIWVETLGNLLYDDDGQISGAVFVTRNTSERKEMEEQIAASRKMYQSVVDTQQEMICRYLPDTTLTFVNDAYCRTFGTTRKELLGQKYLLFLPPEVHHEELESLNKLTSDNPSVTKEFSILLPDGSTVWQVWTDHALFDENGKVIEIQSVGHDITGRKQAEEEAERHARRTEVLLKIASRFNAESELDRVRSAICEETCSALQTQMAAYLYYSKNDRCFYLASSSGLPEEIPRPFPSLRWEDYENIVSKMDKTGLITDLSAMPELPYALLLLSHNISSLAYAVVERDGLPLDIIFAGDAGKEADLPEDTVSLLSGLADQAASAVTNARLLQETKDRLRQVQALRNIDLAITGSLDLRVTFQVVLDEVTGMLNTDAAAILLLDPYSNTLKYEQWRGFQSKDLKSIILPLGKGYGGRAAAERQTILVADLSKTTPDPDQGPLLAKEGFAAYFVVPLVAKGTVKGVLEVYHREPVETTGDWLAFMETLAGRAAIAVDNAQLFLSLERSSVNLLQAYDATIEGWAHALDLKDEETEDHSRRVTEMTVAIARKMNIKDEELAHLRRGALLHDIGKMGIPDSILLKPGKLDDDEWVIMKKHPVYAYEMLAPVDYLKPALDIPYCHHEKFDGTGYPRGLKGKAIPLAARIFAVVDVYDALTSDRPYRKAWSREKTLKHIREESGKHFDPQVVEAFLKELANTTSGN